MVANQTIERPRVSINHYFEVGIAEVSVLDTPEVSQIVEETVLSVGTVAHTPALERPEGLFGRIARRLLACNDWLGGPSVTARERRQHLVFQQERIRAQTRLM